MTRRDELLDRLHAIHAELLKDFPEADRFRTQVEFNDKTVPINQNTVRTVDIIEKFG